MKKLTKVSAFLLALIVGFTTAVPAYAAPVTATKDNLSVTLDILQENYSADETITGTVTLKNTSTTDALINVSLESVVPNGYTLKLGENQSAEIGTIEANGEKTLNLSFVPDTTVKEGVKIFATDFEESNPFKTTIRKLHKIELVECADDSGNGQSVEFKRVIEANNDNSSKSFYMEYVGVGADTTSVVYEFDIKLLDAANTEFRLWLIDTDKKNYYPVRIQKGVLGGSIGGGTFTELAYSNDKTQSITLSDDTWYTISVVCNYKDNTLRIFLGDEEVVVKDDTKTLNVNGVNSVSGVTTAVNVQTMRLMANGKTTIDHFQIDNVRVYHGTQPYDGELIIPPKDPIKLDTSKSIFDIEKLNTDAFPEMLKDYISLHTRNGMIYQGSDDGKEGTKTKLATMPVETENGFLVVAEEICNALGITYSADGNTVTIKGKIADVTDKDGKLWINAQDFFEKILDKQVAIDTVAKSDGMMIAGDTVFEFPSAELFQVGSVNNMRSELQNLNDYLFFDRPTDAQILEAYNASELKGVHPRIMATADDFAKIKEEIKTDPYKKTWYEQLLTLADYLVEENTEPLKYELRDGVRLLFVARDLLCNMHTLGMAYQLTGEQKYVDRAWVDLKAVSEFKDWYAIPLDPAEFSAAVAIGYDWMYNAFTPEQREIIEKAMYENAYRVVCDEYMGNNALLERSVVSYNQCVVINSGFALGALAFMDVYPEVSSYIVSNAIRATDVTLTEYGPDGAWLEGPNYWDYTTQYASKLLSSLETIFRTCFSLDLCEGLSDTADYMLNVQSDQGVFNYNDCGEKVLYAPEMLYLSNKYDAPEVTSAVLELTGGKVQGAECKEEDIVLALLWYDTSIKASEDAMPPLDSTYYSEGVATFRDKWSGEATAFVGVHGGYNRIIHGQLDAGTFVYDYAGTRWVKELGVTPYDTEVTGSYGIDGGRWKLYRSKAEAHNTIVIVNDETSPTGTDQVVDARATLTDVKKDEKGAIAVLDMTAVYAQGATKATRGFFFTDDRTSLVVRDEISLLKDNSTVYSFIHTDAKVELAADKQSAILTQGGTQMKLEFVTSGTGTATLDYGPSTRALLGTTSPINAPVDKDDEDKYDVENAGVNRIYVKLDNASGDVAITVKLTPIGVNSTPVTDYDKSISAWTIPEGEVAPKPELLGVTIDGREINFDASKLATFLSAAGQYTSVPEAVVKVDETKFTYQITDAANMDGGTTTIVVYDKANPNVFATYSINFVEIPKPKNFDEMTSIQVVNVEASDEPQADRGYYRWCALDNDTNSRWTSLGLDNWITLELEEETTLDNAMISFFKTTNPRSAYFSISVSTDGVNWTFVDSFVSELTKEKGLYEKFELGGITAKYIRFECNGNSEQGMIDGWNNIAEIVLTKNGIVPEPSEPSEPSEPTPTSTPTVPDDTETDFDDDEDISNDVNSEVTETISASATPTGDNGNRSFWSILTVITVAGATFIAIHYRKRFKNIVSVLLVCVLMAGMFANALHLNATGTETASEKTLNVEKTVTVGTEPITFSFTVKYTVEEKENESELVNPEIITEGTATSYQLGSNETATILCTGIASELESIMVGDTVVSNDSNANYTIEADETTGTTKLTLTKTYLETLTAGEHTITLNYTENRSASTTLTVIAKPADVTIITDGSVTSYKKKDARGTISILCTGAAEKFSNVTVASATTESATVDAANYTKEATTEGTTKLTFTTTYLESLAEGEYTVTLNYTDNRSTSTTMTIIKSDYDTLIEAYGTPIVDLDFEACEVGTSVTTNGYTIQNSGFKLAQASAEADRGGTVTFAANSDNTYILMKDAYGKRIETDMTKKDANDRMVAGNNFVVYECKIGYNTVGMIFRFFGIGATTNKNCVFGTLEDGIFKDFNGKTVSMAFNSGQMYKVTYVFDIVNKQYDLYINEIKMTTSSLVTYTNFDGFLTDNSSKTIRLDAKKPDSGTNGGDIMIDDIKIYASTTNPLANTGEATD